MLEEPIGTVTPVVYSLRSKLFLATLAVLAVPIASLGIFVLRSFNYHIETHKQHVLAADLSAASLVYMNQFEKLRGIAQAISSENTTKVTLHLGVRAQLRDYLSERAQKHGINMVIVTDAHGKVFCRAGSEAFGDDYSDKELVKQALLGNTITSTERVTNELLATEGIDLEGRPSADDAMLVAQVACPITLKDELIGAVVIGFLLNGNDVLIKQMAAVLQDADIVIRQHDIRVASSLLPADQAPTSDFAILSGTSSTNDATAFSTIAVMGKKYMSTASPLYDHSGREVGQLMALADVDSINAPIANIRDRVLIIGGAGTLLAILISGALSKSLARPIHELACAMEALGKGDLTLQLRHTGRDEVGQLAVGFNRMSQNLLNSRKQLERSREQSAAQAEELRAALENISERTSEIEQANAKLNDEIAYRIHAEDALRAARDELESRVQERTAELARANRDLESEVSERRQAEESLRESNASVVDALRREQLTSTQLEATMKQLEEATQAAQTSTRAKSQFLANMSHEIRTPMNAIIGYADMMYRDSVSNPLSPQQAEAVAAITSSGRHLLDLINEILDLSKIEAGEMQLEITTCHLQDILASVSSIMKPLAGEKRIDFGITNVGPIPETIQSDPIRLKQTIMNLTGNAVKFTDDGKVEIVIRLESTNAGPMLGFEVNDTGIGIAQNHLEKVFEPFSQVDSSSTRRFQGTGLGLAISRRIADALHGSLTATSVVGQGSTFKLSIPTGSLQGVSMLDSLADMGTAKNAPAEETHTMFLGKVLIAEDSPVNRVLLTRMLTRMNIEVITADNGEMAIVRTNTDKPDMIFMDWQMPIMDGMEATMRLRAEGNNIPVIALTANAMQGDKEKCLAAGCNDFLTKPIDHRELTRTLSEYLRPAEHSPQTS